MTKIFNRTEGMKKRRSLRKHATPAEVLLWQRVRNAQVAGAKFRRQYGVGAYVLDFYCPEVKLALELDGVSHENDAAVVYDRKRQAEIESLGIHFLRFTNSQIYRDIGVVLENIALKVEELRSTTASSPERA